MDAAKLAQAAKKAEASGELDKTEEKKSLADTVPGKDQLVQMSRAELDALINDIREEASKKISEAADQVEKLRIKYEQGEAENKVRRQGKDTGDVTVIGPRNLAPYDRLDLIANEHSDKLKGKVGRFVTDRPEIRSLRRSQGYAPIQDENGSEVRYMDSVLMAMPERKYQEEIAKPIDERKAINRRAITEKFKGSAERSGMKVEGEGIQYDSGE